MRPKDKDAKAINLKDRDAERSAIKDKDRQDGSAVLPMKRHVELGSRINAPDIRGKGGLWEWVEWMKAHPDGLPRLLTEKACPNVYKVSGQIRKYVFATRNSYSVISDAHKHIAIAIAWDAATDSANGWTCDGIGFVGQYGAKRHEEGRAHRGKVWYGYNKPTLDQTSARELVIDVSLYGPARPRLVVRPIEICGPGITRRFYTCVAGKVSVKSDDILMNTRTPRSENRN
ncbi:hypothetical protein C8J56DRAFT_905802 [Mycena floridula]|nr:hypothetical protein C8J56DRAFT_905802 [Mycena floridula]